MISGYTGLRKVKFNKLSASFLWTFTGNLAHALCQFCILILMAKCGTAEMVGMFTLSIAIVTPVYMLTYLGLRPVYVTDNIGQYLPTEYLSIRIASSTIGLIIILLVSFFGGYGRDLVIVLLPVAIYKYSESLSNLLHGSFQKNERMDYICISLISRGILSIFCVYAILNLYNSITYAVIGMAISALGVLIVWDFTHFFKLENIEINWKVAFNYKHSINIIKTSYMVGFVALLVSLRSSIPKYLIEHEKGIELLGYFSALAYIIAACTMLSEALGQAIVARLSKYYIKTPEKFINLSIKSIIIGILIGAGLVSFCILFGHEILVILYSNEYSQFYTLLVWLSLSGAFSIIGSVLYYIMISAGKYKLPGYLQIVMVIVTTGVGTMLIPKYGLVGGAYSLLASAIIHALGGSIIFVKILNSLKGANS